MPKIWGKDFTMNIKERAKQLKTDIPALFIALKKKETPLAAKIFATLAVAYALSPIDFIPDFIPVIGYLDDIILLPALVALTIKYIPDEVFSECRKEAEGLSLLGAKKWYFAIPIAVIWLLIAAVTIKAII